MRPNYKMLKDDLLNFQASVNALQSELSKVSYEKLSKNAKERFNTLVTKIFTVGESIGILMNNDSFTSEDHEARWEKLKELIPSKDNFSEKAAGEMNELDEQLGKDDDARMIWSFERRFGNLNKHIVKIEESDKLEADKEAVNGFLQNRKSYSSDVLAHNYNELVKSDAREVEIIKELRKYDENSSDIDIKLNELYEKAEANDIKITNINEQITLNEKEIETNEFGLASVNAEFAANEDAIAVNEKNTKENADSAASVNKEIDEAEKAFDENGKNLEKFASEVKKVEKDVAENEEKIKEYENAIKEINDENARLDAAERSAAAQINSHDVSITMLQRELDDRIKPFDERLAEPEKRLAEKLKEKEDAFSKYDAEIKKLEEKAAEQEAAYRENGEKTASIKNQYYRDAIDLIKRDAADKNIGGSRKIALTEKNNLIGLLESRDALLDLREDIFNNIFENGDAMENDDFGMLGKKVKAFTDICGLSYDKEVKGITSYSALMTRIESEIHLGGGIDDRIEELINFDETDKKFRSFNKDEIASLRNDMKTYGQFFDELNGLRETKTQIYKETRAIKTEIRKTEELKKAYGNVIDDIIKDIRFNEKSGIETIKKEKESATAKLIDMIDKYKTKKADAVRKSDEIKESNAKVRLSNEEKLNKLNETYSALCDKNGKLLEEKKEAKAQKDYFLGKASDVTNIMIKLNASKEKLEKDANNLKSSRTTLESTRIKLREAKDGFELKKQELADERAGFNKTKDELLNTKRELKKEEKALSNERAKKKIDLNAERAALAEKKNKILGNIADITYSASETDDIAKQSRDFHQRQNELTESLSVRNNEIGKDYMQGTIDNVFNELCGFYIEKDFGKKKNHEDSPEYKNMIDSIKNILGDRINGKNPNTPDKLMKSLDKIRNTAAEYVRLKNNEWSLIPSTQRKARLDFANRLCSYATEAMGDLADRRKKVENFKDNARKQNLNDTFVCDDKGLNEKLSSYIKSRRKEAFNDVSLNEPGKNFGPVNN